MDSPRGRIVLMKQVLEGGLTPGDAQPYIDRCLGCLACETNCPSGVRYRELLVPYRSHVERASRTMFEQVWRKTLAVTIESPSWFRRALSLGRFGRFLTRGLPATLRPMVRLVPDHLPPVENLPSLVPAPGARRAGAEQPDRVHAGLTTH